MFFIGILILAMLFLIFIAVIFNSVQICSNGEILMSVVDQTADLTEATNELTAAVADEKAQVAQAISALNDRIADLEAAAPDEVDLSEQIAAVRAAADGVRAIYEPVAETGEDNGDGPVPITADPVADDTEATEAPADDSETADPTAPTGFGG